MSHRRHPQNFLECRTFLVRERGLTQLAHPRGGITSAKELSRGRHDPLKLLVAPLVSIAIPFDKPSVLHDFQGQAIIYRSRAMDLREPTLQTLHFAVMTQRVPAEAPHSSNDVQREESGQLVGLDTATFVEQAVQDGTQTRATLDPRSDATWQRANHLTHAWMHEFRRVKNFRIFGASFLADTLESPRTDLEIRYPDHIVIRHTHGNLTRGFRRQRKPVGLTAGVTIR